MKSAKSSDGLCVALLDDDAEIRDLVIRYLERYGVVCHGVGSRVALERLLNQERVDLLLLDIMLPDGDGLEVCRALRETSGLPIILLTALADESDRVLGLEMGADDYLTKPFSARELLARIRAVLRRSGEALWVHRADGDEYHFADWCLSLPRRSLTNPAGALVSLTGGEFDLLVALVANAGKVLNRDQLLAMTKGRQAQAFDRSVDVQLSRLRRKLGAQNFIKTVRGGGYQFTEPVEHA